MWNHLVRFNGQAYEAKYRNLNVDASGRVDAGHRGHERPGVSVLGQQPSRRPTTYWRIKLDLHRPGAPRRRGADARRPARHRHQGPPRLDLPARPAPREGRARPAHDTPNPGTAGATTFDDTFIFNGSMDRFDFKLVGKKEMFVPYNDYAAVYQAKQDDLLKPNHLNPDLVRWELHRVWVVEATLKEGKRHVYSKRTFYLDEDSWAALACDEYDARGQLYRAGFAYMAPSYDLPAPYTDMFGHYDLVSRLYSLTGFIAETGGLRHTKPLRRARVDGRRAGRRRRPLTQPPTSTAMQRAHACSWRSPPAARCRSRPARPRRRPPSGLARRARHAGAARARCAARGLLNGPGARRQAHRRGRPARPRAAVATTAARAGSRPTCRSAPTWWRCTSRRASRAGRSATTAWCCTAPTAAHLDAPARRPHAGDARRALHRAAATPSGSPKPSASPRRAPRTRSSTSGSRTRATATSSAPSA